MMRTLALVVVLTSACSDATTQAPLDMARPVDPLFTDRPYGVNTPSGFDHTQSWPLIVVLHGYGASGVSQDAYLGISAEADKRGFVVALPDGTVDFQNMRFWNATDACCDFAETGIDDAGYVTALIKDATVRYHIDPKRVFLVGHSNGAFMAHRMACDHADLIAGIAALAGETYADPARCAPSREVAVAQIHGDADTVVKFTGGMLPTRPAYPSTPTTFEFWKTRNGCAADAEQPPLDLVDVLPAAETLVTRANGCDDGAAELWKIQGGDHVPLFNGAFAKSVLDFFGAHPRL